MQDVGEGDGVRWSGGQVGHRIFVEIIAVQWSRAFA